MAKKVLFSLTVFLLVASYSFAQISTGSIAGTVLDSSKGVVPGVSITSTNMGTRDTRETISDDNGAYNVPLLPPGRYSVEFALPGFKTLIQEGVTVNVTEKVTVNATLEVATAQETVTVEADGEILQTNSSTLGRVVDTTSITMLPLATRNFTQLTALSPGSSITIPDTQAVGNGSQNVYTNGGTHTSNSYTIDGVDATNNFSGSAGSDFGNAGVAVPSVDAIQEFKVQTSLYDASHGRKAGANISVVTKSGGSEFHGSLYHFFRNDALNANNFFFNSLGAKRPTLQQNQFGGTIGGPIIEDRTFFFFNYEGNRQKNGASNQLSIRTLRAPPLPDIRTPETLGAVFGGQRGRNGGVVAPDGSNINPVALNMLNVRLGSSGEYMLPGPQVNTPAGPNYAISLPAIYNNDQFSTSLDHQLTQNNRMSVRYFYADSSRLSHFNQTQLPGFPESVPNHNQNVTVSNTHIFGSNKVNELRAGYVRFRGANTVIPEVTDADVGMHRDSQERLPGMPRINIQGSYQFGNVGTETNLTSNVYSLMDTFSLGFEAKGRHDLRFGGEIRKEQHNVRLPSIQSVGVMVIRSIPDLLLGMRAGPGGTGTALSNVHVSGITSGIGHRDMRTDDYNLFIADDWKITQKFTLNLGLRWEFLGPGTDTQGRMSNFEPRRYEIPPDGGTSAAGWVQPGNAELVVPGTPLVSDSMLDSDDYNNFAPRIGFAYRPMAGGSLVIRAGYGIFYERIHQRPQLVSQGVGSPPFINRFILPGPQNRNATLQNPFPALTPLEDFPVPFVIPGRGVRLPATFSQLTDPTMRSPSTQHFSLNTQFSLREDYLIEVGYVGSRASHVAKFRNFNQSFLASPERPINSQTSNSAANRLARRPLIGMVQPLSGTETTGIMNYHSLQASVTKRFSDGLQFLAGYTFSKALGTVGTRGPDGTDLGGFAGGSQDALNVRGDGYGRPEFDRPHRFVFSWNYELPAPDLGSGFAREFLGGWVASGIVILQSGTPFSVNDRFAASLFSSPGGRASFAEGANINTAQKSGRTQDRLNEYFNTSAFTRAPTLRPGDTTPDGFPISGPGTYFGDTGRNIMRGPGQTNLDLAIIKRTRLTEGTYLEFRSEFFNILNVANFRNPGSNVSIPQSYGIIGRTSSAPRVIQFALKLIF